jgi:hypothetical protein
MRSKFITPHPEEPEQSEGVSKDEAMERLFSRAHISYVLGGKPEDA